MSEIEKNTAIINALQSVMDKINEILNAQFSSRSSDLVTCSQFVGDIGNLLDIVDSLDNFEQIVALTSTITTSDVDKDTCTSDHFSLLAQHMMELQAQVDKLSSPPTSPGTVVTTVSAGFSPSSITTLSTIPATIESSLTSTPNTGSFGSPTTSEPATGQVSIILRWLPGGKISN